MIKIHLTNIQAIKDCEFTLDGPGVVEFTGNNSNGKSILTKSLMELTTGGIKNKRKRKTLIRTGEAEGAIIVVRDSMCLATYLHEELKDCYYIWIPDTSDMNNKLVRPLNDDGFRECLEEIGFKSFPTDNICLQIAPTRGAVPFITTSYQTNAIIAKSVLEDRAATKFVKQFKEITYPKVKTLKDSYNAEIQRIEFALSQLSVYDWRPYEVLYKQMKDAIARSSVAYVPKVNLEPPQYSIMEPLDIKLKPTLNILNFDKLDTKLTLFTDVLIDWKKIHEGVCPTCGQQLNNCIHQDTQECVS